MTAFPVSVVVVRVGPVVAHRSGPLDSDLPFRVALADLNCVTCEWAKKKGATEAAPKK
jgi:hypothetical protein